MADDDCVANENLFYQQPDNALPLVDVEAVRRGPQALQERRQRFGETQMGGAILCLGRDRL
jgi:hypothetical protein